MDEVLKDIPVDGKITTVVEDTIPGGSLIAPRTDLRTTFTVGNKAVGIDQPISFIRSGQPGEILSSLINDFKDGKDIRVKGKVSYFLVHPIAEMRFIFFKRIGLPKEIKGKVKAVAHLVNTEDWRNISEEDRAALTTFVRLGQSVFSEPNNLMVSVDGKDKYEIGLRKYKSSGVIFLLPKQE